MKTGTSVVKRAAAEDEVFVGSFRSWRFEFSLYIREFLASLGVTNGATVTLHALCQLCQERLLPCRNHIQSTHILK